jgi:hypothetical protein
MLVLRVFEVSCVSSVDCWDEKAGWMGAGIQPQNMGKGAQIWRSGNSGYVANTWV